MNSKLEWKKNKSRGKSPVPNGITIEIKQRDGDIIKTNKAETLRWTRCDSHDDIIEYREKHIPIKNNPTNLKVNDKVFVWNDSGQPVVAYFASFSADKKLIYVFTYGRTKQKNKDGYFRDVYTNWSHCDGK